MTAICELGLPTGDCAEIVAYVQTLIDAVKDTAFIKFGSGASNPDPEYDDLNELWEPCDPPTCALVVWHNTYSNWYVLYYYTGVTWIAVSVTDPDEVPYYTEFQGSAGVVQEEWVGGWVIDGNGRCYPRFVLGEELALNPNMEDWTGGVIDDWTVNGTVTEEVGIVRSGSAARCTDVGSSAGLSQTITISAGSWIYLSGFMYRIPTSLIVTLGQFPTLTCSNVFPVGGSVSIAVNEEWVKHTLGAFVHTANPVIGVSQGYTLLYDPLFIVDTTSVREIEEGWCIYREQGTAYGTLYADITLSGYRSIMGLLVNYSPTSNAYYAVFLANSGTSIYVYQVVAGVATLVGAYGVAYVDGARLEVVRSGTTLDVNYNGASVVVGLTPAISLQLTHHGIVSNDPASFVTAYGFIPE